MKTLRLIVLITSLSVITACTESGPVTPADITQGTVCSLDGMLLMDYPGPKAQIHYAGQAPEFFCDTVEMFSIYLRPEQQRKITGIFTQDMGKADWKEPKGNWIDARSAFYVYGPKITGSMGPTFAAFANRELAQAFAKEHDGKVIPFNEVNIDMVDLRGGAKHDQSM